MAVLYSILGILTGYLLGSIPSALIVSRIARGVDIRTLGDGNLGARNTARSLGMRYGVVVAAADFCKGAMAVLISTWLGFGAGIQMAAGAAAVVGHDFPLFARFKGGQGLATSLGVMLALFPMQAIIGLFVYEMLFLITKRSNLAAAVGCGLIALILGLETEWVGLTLVVILFISIPIKKLIDLPREKAIHEKDNKKSQV